MSYDDAAGVSIDDVLESTHKAINALKNVPIQSRLVSDLTIAEANKISREINRVRAPTPKSPPHNPQKQIKKVKAPTIPQQPPTKTGMGYEQFAGKRRKQKDTFSIFLGR
jgi:hypothetical protein